MSASDLGAPGPLPVPQVEFFAAIRADLAPPIEVGMVDGMQREVFPIVGGEADGPIAGVILPGGADWAWRRADGSYRIRAQYCLRLADGTILAITNEGRMWPGPGGSFEGRTKAEIECPAGPHAWLTDAVFFGTARAWDEQPDAVYVELWRAVLAGSA